MRSGVANRPTHSVPNTPLTRCTDVAPTGSSILILSNPSTASTTSTPATAPMPTETAGVTNAQGAVIATRPARQPLIVMPMSGLPSTSQQVSVAVLVAAAAAVDRHADGGLAQHEPAGDRRGHGRGARSQVRRHGNFRDRARIDPHRAARVKAEPAEPQDEAADHGGSHVVPRNRVHPAVSTV